MRRHDPGPVFAAAAAIVLSALAAAYYFTVEPAATVKVRWRDTVSEAQRTAHERRFLLTGPIAEEPRTFRYDLLDTRPANLQAIVEHPDVEDTAEIERTRFQLQPDYAYGTGWMWIAHRVPLLRVRGVVPALSVACGLVIALHLTAVARRRQTRARDAANVR